jgi:chaperonin GroEL
VEHGTAALEDLAVVTGATLISAITGRSAASARFEDLGRARRAEAGGGKLRVIGGDGEPTVIAGQIEQVRAQIARGDLSLRERLARLTSGIAVVRVGAATRSEIANARVRAENARDAMLAAVEEGVVVGGGVAFLRCSGALDGELPAELGLVRRMMQRVLEEPLRQIAANAGVSGSEAVGASADGGGAHGFNAVTGRFGDLFVDGVIDPVKVLRIALEKAASGATMLLTAASTSSSRDRPRLALTRARSPAATRAVRAGGHR